MWLRIGSTARAFYDMVYLGFVAGTHAGSLVSTFPSEAARVIITAFSGKCRLSAASEQAGEPGLVDFWLPCTGVNDRIACRSISRPE